MIYQKAKGKRCTLNIDDILCTAKYCPAAMEELEYRMNSLLLLARSNASTSSASRQVAPKQTLDSAAGRMQRRGESLILACGSYGRERPTDGARNSCGSSPSPARRSRYLDSSRRVIRTSQDLLHLCRSPGQIGEIWVKSATYVRVRPFPAQLSASTSPQLRGAQLSAHATIPAWRAPSQIAADN
jgi:hypothetical protein